MKILNSFTKIVRQLDPQKRENLAGEIVNVTNALKATVSKADTECPSPQLVGLETRTGRKYGSSPLGRGRSYQVNAKLG
jgi:hypothetical protein